MNIPWDDIEALFPRAQNGIFVALRDVGVPLMELTNKVRLCYAIANFAHESGGFTRLKEIGGDSYFTKLYEGRRDLGNNQPGDGARFCGRGIIQITGRVNYTACSEYTEIDCVNHPELLELPIEANQSASWYWKTRTYKNLSMNDWCDRRDFNRIVKMINGGLNGLSNRKRYLSLVSKTMDLRL